MRLLLTNQKNGKSETKRIILKLRQAVFVNLFYYIFYYFVIMFSEATVAVGDVVDRCFVTCGEDLNCSVEEYTARGINYFYFLEVGIFSRWLFS